MGTFDEILDMPLVTSTTEQVPFPLNWVKTTYLTRITVKVNQTSALRHCKLLSRHIMPHTV